MVYPHVSIDEPNEGNIHTFDGVGAMLRGDLLTISAILIASRTTWASRSG